MSLGVMTWSFLPLLKYWHISRMRHIFHGSVFSIKYNKAFCTIIRNMNNQKLSYLLKQFHLESRIINDIDKLDSILTTPIDYKEINEYIAKETRCSIEYLKTNICK